MEIRTQKIELNPNNKQATLMAQHAGYARVAFNFALSSFKAGLDSDDGWRTYQDIKKEFNAVKRERFDWCDNLAQNASKNAIHNFGDAVSRWKSGQNNFPTYKKRSGKCSYQADNGVGTVKVHKKRIDLPKIGWVRMREELRFTGEVSKIVVSKRNNHWFVSILVRCDSGNYTYQPPLFDDSDFGEVDCASGNLPNGLVGEQRSPTNLSKIRKQPIGVDVGINTLATCSDGVVYDNPRPLKRYQRKLRRANKALSRKVYLSKNWQKAKKRLGSVHYRIGCIREDAHHKASTAIVKRATAIGIETLNISGLLKNRRKPAKALSDSALSRFLTMLKYKAERRGIPITEADLFFASSKTCSNCGHKKNDLTLSDRTYHCTECGFESDRDVNAAINLCPA